MIAPARIAPLWVATEEAQQKYAIHGFQAVISLKTISASDMKLVMSPYTSEYWSSVEDLEPLVKAIDFFRSHAERGSEALSADNSGVADLPAAEGSGQETQEAAEVF